MGGKVCCGFPVLGTPPGEGPPAAGTPAKMIWVFAFHSASLTTATSSPAKAPAHHAEIQKVFDHVSGFLIYFREIAFPALQFSFQPTHRSCSVKFLCAERWLEIEAGG